jgi:hypothetical protein
LTSIDVVEVLIEGPAQFGAQPNAWAAPGAINMAAAAAAAQR